MNSIPEAMMNNTSKIWLQALVNDNWEELNKAILMAPCVDENIQWMSPLMEEDYIEYTLSSPELHSKLKEHRIYIKKEWLEFWPNMGPSWDAIGVAGELLILAIASTNIKETYSSIPHTLCEKERKQVEESMRIAYQNISKNGDFDAWLNKHYELGERLTFIYFLRKYGINAKLVILNQANNSTCEKTSDTEWCCHYYGDKNTRGVFETMVGSKPRNVILRNLKIGN